MNSYLMDLMKKWKKYEKERLGADYKYFIEDGIINYEKWVAQSGPKICYLLKESYDKDFDKRQENEEFNLIEWINQNPKYMWKRLTVWTQAIQLAHAHDIISYKREDIDEKEITDIISFINIKKSNGISLSKNEELDFLSKDKKTQIYIKEELDIINPDIIICGNTFEFLKTILNNEIDDLETQDGYTFWKDKIVIDFCHPAARYPYKLTFYALIAIYKAALASQSHKK